MDARARADVPDKPGKAARPIGPHAAIGGCFGFPHDTAVLETEETRVARRGVKRTWARPGMRVSLTRPMAAHRAVRGPSAAPCFLYRM